LEDTKKRLSLQLFDADDRLLGDLYDEQHEIKQLRYEIEKSNEELSTPELDPNVAMIKAQGGDKAHIVRAEEEI
jgi:hypothetical protein